MDLLSCLVALLLPGQPLKKFSKKLQRKSMETPAVIGLAKAGQVITLKWYTTVCFSFFRSIAFDPVYLKASSMATCN